jgi:RNA polymerase sigma-70 factor (ECF subfamily)
VSGDRTLDVARLVAGDKAAWDAFVARYAGVVHAGVGAVLRRAGSHPVDLADLVQDVFVRLCKDDYRMLRNYDPARASLVTWLTVVSRSVALDAMRRKYVTQVNIDDAPEAALAVSPRESAKITIPPGLLTARQALVLSLLYDRDMDPAEVASKLDVDVQTVRSTHHKALTRLRQYFREHPGE